MPMKQFVQAQQELARGKLTAPTDPGPKDRRFSDPLWDQHPYFNYVKQQYLMNAEAVANAVSAVEGLDPKEQKRLE